MLNNKIEKHGPVNIRYQILQTKDLKRQKEFFNFSIIFKHVEDST